MIKSMTGFGRAEYISEGREYIVEIRAVNHRYLDLTIRLPRQYLYLEDKIRKLTNEYVKRGKVEVFVTINMTGLNNKVMNFDYDIIEGYINEARVVEQKYGMSSGLNALTVLKLPDVIKMSGPDTELVESEIEIPTKMALENLVHMRGTEGERLKADILNRIGTMENFLGDIMDRTINLVPEYKEKLENRIKDLIDTGKFELDEGRLLQETVIFADKCSIEEETTRLTSHIKQAKAFLNEKEAVGKKFDFLIQEMNREINTIGSKANDLHITKNVVELKNELENIREQVQNIE